MIQLLKSLFKPEGSETQPVTDEALHTTCLALLFAVARADGTVSDEELDKTISIATSLWQWDHGDLRRLIAEAQTKEQQATSLYEFTSIINEHLSDSDKYRMIFSLWQIAFADGHIDRYEEHVIRRVADLIYVEHSRFIQAKHEAEAQGKNKQ